MTNPPHSTRQDENPAAVDPPSPLECCNSGCRFCILDYPELFTLRTIPVDTQVCDENELARALQRAEEILQYLDTEGEF